MRVRAAILEHTVIVFGIVSLWPYILGYRGRAATAVMLTAVVLLGALTYMRVRRYRRMLSGIEQSHRVYKTRY